MAYPPSRAQALGVGEPYFVRREPNLRRRVDRHEAAGKSSAPVTRQGAMRFFAQSKTRVLCTHCGSLQSIADVHRVEQKPKSVCYEVMLECRHQREMVVNVSKPAQEKLPTVLADRQTIPTSETYGLDEAEAA
jgi:hypothetical protein